MEKDGGRVRNRHRKDQWKEKDPRNRTKKPDKEVRNRKESKGIER